MGGKGDLQMEGREGGHEEKVCGRQRIWLGTWGLWVLGKEERCPVAPCQSHFLQAHPPDDTVLGDAHFPFLPKPTVSAHWKHVPPSLHCMMTCLVSVLPNSVSSIRQDPVTDVSPETSMCQAQVEYCGRQHEVWEATCGSLSTHLSDTPWAWAWGERLWGWAQQRDTVASPYPFSPANPVGPEAQQDPCCSPQRK